MCAQTWVWIELLAAGRNGAFEKRVRLDSLDGIHRPGASLSTSVLQPPRYPSNRSRQDTYGFIKRISTAMHTVSRNCGASQELHQQSPSSPQKASTRKHLHRSPLGRGRVQSYRSVEVQSADLIIDTEHLFGTHYRNCRFAHTACNTTTPPQSAICTAFYGGTVLRRSGPLPASLEKRLPLFRYEFSPWPPWSEALPCR